MPERPISIQAAVESAMHFVKLLYGSTTPKDLLLEEIELTPDEGFWLVTIGFFIPGGETTDSIANLLGEKKKPIRTYKVIKINAQTGEPISMKIRQQP